MHVVDAVTRLDGFHARIDAVLERGRAALGAAAVESVTMAQLRWEVLRLLREYQLFKHLEIFNPLIRSIDAGRRARATLLKERCIAISNVVNAHTQRWTLAGTADQDSYVVDARELIGRLADHLAQERLGVVQLLDGLQRTRQA